MANKAQVKAKVISPFVDKHTREVRKRGSVFLTDEKRVKEINAGRKVPLVTIVASEEKKGAQAGETSSAPSAKKPEAKGEDK